MTPVADVTMACRLIATAKQILGTNTNVEPSFNLRERMLENLQARGQTAPAARSPSATALEAQSDSAPSVMSAEGSVGEIPTRSTNRERRWRGDNDPLKTLAKTLLFLPF